MDIIICLASAMLCYLLGLKDAGARSGRLLYFFGAIGIGLLFGSIGVASHVYH